MSSDRSQSNPHIIFCIPQIPSQNTVFISSRKPNSSSFLRKMHSLTSWQLCSIWWNSSHKFDKEAVLNVFWIFLKKSSKVEQARWRQTDKLLLERRKRSMHSSLAQLKFASGETPLKSVRKPSYWYLNTWCISRELCQRNLMYGVVVRSVPRETGKLVRTEQSYVKISCRSDKEKQERKCVSGKVPARSIQKCTVFPVNMSVQGNVYACGALVLIQAKPSIDT